MRCACYHNLTVYSGDPNMTSFTDFKVDILIDNIWKRTRQYTVRHNWYYNNTQTMRNMALGWSKKGATTKGSQVCSIQTWINGWVPTKYQRLYTSYDTQDGSFKEVCKKHNFACLPTTSYDTSGVIEHTILVLISYCSCWWMAIIVGLEFSQCRDVHFHSAPSINKKTISRSWKSGRGRVHWLVRLISHCDADDNHVECDGDDRRDLAIGNKMSMEELLRTNMTDHV